MASASSLLSEENLLCSICLDVFTDPISTSCGHNYCQACITHYWDTSDTCHCPLCNKIFSNRPEVSVNKVLSEMVDHFRSSARPSKPEPAKPDEVSCDICTEPKLKALKSCLVCLASYCETHLEPHLRVTAFKRHKLIDPVKNLEDITCQKHDRPLELFCQTDLMCVCQFCTQSDHRSHQIVSLKEAYDGKKAELEKTEAEVQQLIWERQGKIREVKRSVALGKKAADEEMAGSEKVFTALISCIQRSQAEVRNEIEHKQKSTEKQAEGLIKELQQEITQLEKRSSELKELSHTEDHIQLLQNFTPINAPVPVKDWTNFNVPPSSYVGTVRTALDQLKKTLSKEMENQIGQNQDDHDNHGLLKLVPQKDQEHSAPIPQRGQEASQSTEEEPMEHQETTPTEVSTPLTYFVYLNQAYREEMQCIERESGVTINAEVKVSFVVVPSNNDGRSPDPDQARDKLIDLLQKCSLDLDSVTVPLSQEAWMRVLQSSLREESRLVLSVSRRELTVSGPSKSMADVRQSLPKPSLQRVTSTNGSSSSSAASGRDRRVEAREIGMPKKDPAVSGGLRMHQIHWTTMHTMHGIVLENIMTKYNVLLDPKLSRDEVTVRVKAAGGGSIVRANSLESHAYRALLRLYQKVLTSSTAGFSSPRPSHDPKAHIQGQRGFPQPAGKQFPAVS